MAWEDCRKPANSSHRGASRRWSSASNATKTMIAISAQVAMRRGTLGRRKSAARAIDSLAASSRSPDTRSSPEPENRSPMRCRRRSSVSTMRVPSRRRYMDLWEEFSRDRVRRFLVEPNGRRHPPPLSVPEELQGVDAAPFDRPVRRAPLLVRAEHLDDVSVGPGDAVDLPLEEPIVHHGGIGAVDERLVIHHAGVGPLVSDPRRHEPEVGDVERAVARPLPRPAGGAGDDVVVGLYDTIHRGYVGGAGRDHRHVHVPARRRLCAERDGKEERDRQETNRVASRHAFSGADGRVFLTYWRPIATPSPTAPAPSASRVRSSGTAKRSQSS